MSVTQWLHNAAFALALSTGMPVLPPESEPVRRADKAAERPVPANDQAAPVQQSLRLNAAD